MTRTKSGFVASLALIAAASAVGWVTGARRGQRTPRRSPRASRPVAEVAAPGEVSESQDPVVRATSPLPILRRQWKAVLRGALKRINDDRLLLVAAGVVFYGLLALFPGITALVSSYALFADGSTINSHLQQLAAVVPAGTYSVIEDQVGRVLANGDTKLGLAFLSSLALALWSANGGLKAVIDALNVVYDENESRGFIKLNAVSLGFTLGGLGAVLSAIGLVVAVPIVLSMIGMAGKGALLIAYGRWPLLALLTLAGLAVLYRHAPDRPSPRWRWVLPGGVFATLTWIAGSALLSYYLGHFADYDATYGSLGAAIGLMVWMWMSAIVVLVGGELNAEIEALAGSGRLRRPGTR
ncbi:MAG: YihY/virulence factor BrkB family protein [Rhodopseudomonas palustris]|uniref:YihY/virulence factor BrkB family protein n=1 Tax=Rhodopseudomonas palustris TaxID=1076 RepID=A0A933VU66_RHOPL|nr:YihY/virulence factor BrkB family protein [Rhodopseudomonas palustris]